MAYENSTPTDRAKNQLLTLNSEQLQGKVLSSNQESHIVIHYFQAKDQILYHKHNKKINLSNKQDEIFNKNIQLLDRILQRIMEEEISDLLQVYSEAILISGLVSAIRKYEANIDSYPVYKELILKLDIWREIGIINTIVQISIKTLKQSVTELEDWIESNAKKFLPFVESFIKIFDLKPEEKSIDYNKILEYFLAQHLSDKDIFYFITNVLKTNPILYENIKSMLNSDSTKINDFRTHILTFLEVLENFTDKERLKRLITLFKKQIELAK